MAKGIHNYIEKLPVATAKNRAKPKVTAYYTAVLTEIEKLSDPARPPLESSATSIPNSSDEHNKLKHMAHINFDRFWKDYTNTSSKLTSKEVQSREYAYIWLNGHFGDEVGIISAHSGIAHMHELNAVGCVRVINLCDKLTREFGSVDSAKEEIQRWNNTRAFEVQLSSRSIVPSTRDVRQRQKREKKFISDPTEGLEHFAPKLAPKIITMSREESLELVTSALSDIRRNISVKKRLSTTQNYYIKAISKLLEEQGIIVPESRLDRLKEIEEHQDLLLLLPEKSMEIARVEQREHEETKERQYVPDTRPKEHANHSRRYRGAKPYIAGSVSSKSTDPVKQAQREERGAQQSQRKEVLRQREEEQVKRQAKFTQKPLSTAEKKARKNQSYKRILSHMNDRQFQKHYEGILEQRITLISESGTRWEGISIKGCQHGPTITPDIFGIIPAFWDGISSAEPGKPAIKLAHPEYHKGKVLCISKAEYNKFCKMIEQTNERIEIARPIFEQRMAEKEELVAAAKEKQKKSDSLKLLGNDFTYLLSSCFNKGTFDITKIEERRIDGAVITFSHTTPKHWSEITQQPGFSDNLAMSISALKAFHTIGIPVTKLETSSKLSPRMTINAGRAHPRIKALNKGKAVPSYDEMVPAPEEAGHHLTLRVKGGAKNITVIVDASAIEKIHQRAEELRHELHMEEGSSISRSEGIATRTLLGYDKSIPEQSNNSALSYITGAIFTPYIRNELTTFSDHKGVDEDIEAIGPVVDAVLQPMDKAERVVTEVALLKAKISYSKREIDGKEYIIVEHVNGDSANNKKITEITQQKQRIERIEQRINTTPSFASSRL